jgi:hypothetical protein
VFLVDECVAAGRSHLHADVPPTGGDHSCRDAGGHGFAAPQGDDDGRVDDGASAADVASLIARKVLN